MSKSARTVTSKAKRVNGQATTRAKRRRRTKPAAVEPDLTPTKAVLVVETRAGVLMVTMGAEEARAALLAAVSAGEDAGIEVKEFTDTQTRSARKLLLLE